MMKFDACQLCGAPSGGYYNCKACALAATAKAREVDRSITMATPPTPRVPQSNDKFCIVEGCRERAPAGDSYCPNHRKQLRETKLQNTAVTVTVGLPPQTREEKASEVREERGKLYGEPQLCHSNIGLVWTGILQDWWQERLPSVIPAHVVELMLVGLKTCRAAKPLGHNPDDYVDARNYLNFAEEGDPQRAESSNAK